jgi:hypothetical protein
MNYMELWMKQKKELLETIRIGKEEDEKSYNQETYHLIQEGNAAADRLARMCEMECELYFCDEDEAKAYADNFVINCDVAKEDSKE